MLFRSGVGPISTDSHTRVEGNEEEHEERDEHDEEHTHKRGITRESYEGESPGNKPPME